MTEEQTPKSGFGSLQWLGIVAVMAVVIGLLIWQMNKQTSQTVER